MESLPRPAPGDPLILASTWLAEATQRVAKNPWAMALAGVSNAGAPSVRYVLLKALSVEQAHLVFYTNYISRKATELDTTGKAAAALYWPDAGRQLRFEGSVSRSPDDESDAYFASRPRASQLNAWASAQSQPIDSPDLMAARVAELETEFPATAPIPRPEGWGGYRLHIASVEFWVEGADRFHERLRYRRDGDGSWSHDWLQA